MIVEPTPLRTSRATSNALAIATLTFAGICPSGTNGVAFLRPEST